MVAELDQVGAEGQAGQVGATAAANLIPDAVQVGADRGHANVQLGGDLGVGSALGDQGDQLLFPGTELSLAWQRCGGLTGGEHASILGCGVQAHRRATGFSGPGHGVS